MSASTQTLPSPTTTNFPNGITAGSTKLLGKLIYESSVDTIASAGSTQATATVLTSEVNRVTSGTGGVALPASAAGLTVYIINHSGAPLQVYGQGSDTIDDVVAATGVTQMNGSLCVYSCSTAGAWYSNGIGTGYSGSFPTVSYTNAITAHAGGGQQASSPLNTVINRVTTVATAADSVTLPVDAPGMQLTVINAAAANSMNVFPNTGDAINALAANAAFAVAANKTATFYSTVAGQWHSLLTA